MDRMLKQYLDRAKEIIGERTASEIAHDNVIVSALNSGLSIEEALTRAGKSHPDEALQWDAGNINDIAAHYDYLKEHEKIMKLMKKNGRKQRPKN